MNMTDTQVLNGSGGKVWINEEHYANVEKISIKVTGKFEEVNCAGDYKTYQQYVGYSIAGTLTLNKVNSFAGNTFAESYKTGIMPYVKIVTKLENPATKKAERCVITGIKFSEFSLVDFEAKALCKEEIPFTAVDYKYEETMD